MSKTLSAGLAWAIPVNPVKLIEDAHAYLKIEPKLRTLRMCHRFGQGDDVHITKLPNEIEQMIEACMVHTSIWRGDDSLWDCSFDFACFQSECTPAQHCSEATPLLESAYDDLELCKVCSEDSIWGDDYDKCGKRCKSDTVDKCKKCKYSLDEACERGCRAEYEEATNMICLDTDMFWEDHHERKSQWLSRISQSPAGAFIEYDKIIRESFGLEVWFAHTTPDWKDLKTWPEHEAHRWHRSDELQTTLCFLTLPKRQGTTSIHEPSEMSIDCGDPAVSGARAYAVDVTSLAITEKQRRQFQHAMKLLELRPYVHGSQDYKPLISANTRLDASSGAEHKERSLKDSELSSWPRLLLLARSD